MTQENDRNPAHDARRGVHRVAAFLGYGYVLAGLAINRFTLAPFTDDGAISGLRTNVAILAFQAALVGYGVLSMRARWTRIREVTLLGASVLVGLVLAEAGLRVHLFGLSAFSYSQMASLHTLGESGMLQPSPHSGVGFELRPSLDRVYKLVPFRTNAAGLRDREAGPGPSLAKPDGLFRVAVLGDSYTMATGVHVRDAYPSVLGRLLDEDVDGRVEVLNFGVGGYTLRHYRALLEERVLEYEPDLVVIGFCPENDYLVPPPYMFADGFEPLAPRSGATRLHALEFLANLRRLDRPTTIQPDEIEYMRGELARIATAVADADVPTVVAYLAIRPTPVERVAGLVAEAGLGWVDAGGPLPEQHLREHSIYYPLDIHPDSSGHAVFASEILGFLRDTHSELLGR